MGYINVIGDIRLKKKNPQLTLGILFVSANNPNQSAALIDWKRHRMMIGTPLEN